MAFWVILGHDQPQLRALLEVYFWLRCGFLFLPSLASSRLKVEPTRQHGGKEEGSGSRESGRAAADAGANEPVRQLSRLPRTRRVPLESSESGRVGEIKKIKTSVYS